MKVLFISNLFPDAEEPNRGIYNARLLHHLSRHCEIRVISPRPSLPVIGKNSFRPRPEDAAFKPVFPVARYVPKIGSSVNHRLMSACLRKATSSLRKSFEFEICLVAWAYPDAVSVSTLAADWGVPFVAVGQGSDIHQYLQMPVRRRLIIEAFNKAGAVIVRSQELGRLLGDAGVKQICQVVYNGVDAAVFRPGDKNAARRELEIDPAARVILYVGNLVPIKNPNLLLEAMGRLVREKALEKLELIFVGDGSLRADLERVAEEKKLKDRVRFAGRQPENLVARYLQASDVLCVPSDNEGVPNVLLEAFACGLPAVATRVGGIPEVLSDASLGGLVERRNPDQLATALKDFLSKETSSQAILKHAQAYSWSNTAACYFDVLEQSLRTRMSAR